MVISPPDVRCVSRNVIFRSSIKMLLCTSGWWTDALVFCPNKRKNINIPFKKVLLIYIYSKYKYLILVNG